MKILFLVYAILGPLCLLYGESKADELYKQALRYGEKKNFSLMLKHYRLAADSGHAQAMGALAACYRDGRGVSSNLEEAHRWYMRAADAGLNRARWWTAGMMFRGDGERRYYAEASEAYERLDENDRWVAICHFLTKAKMNGAESAVKDLNTYRAEKGRAKHFAEIIIDFHLGIITENMFKQKMKAVKGVELNVLLSELHYHRGMKSVFDGDLNGAKARIQECLQVELPGYNSYLFARAEWDDIERQELRLSSLGTVKSFTQGDTSTANINAGSDSGLEKNDTVYFKRNGVTICRGTVVRLRSDRSIVEIGPTDWALVVEKALEEGCLVFDKE